MSHGAYKDYVWDTSGVPRDERRGFKLDPATYEAIEKAMQRAQELWGVPYGSVSDFVLDTLRERVKAINEAWRDAHAVRDRLGLNDPKKRKE